LPRFLKKEAMPVSRDEGRVRLTATTEAAG